MRGILGSWHSWSGASALAAFACWTATPACAADSAEITHVEITQSLQDIQHSVPLIAGKRTFARVFVDYRSAAPARNVKGTLELRRDDGTTVTVDSLPAISNVLDPAQNGKLDVKRKTIEGSLLFELPVPWTRAGNVSVSLASLKLHGGAALNCTNCPHGRSVKFGDAASMKVVLVGMRYVRDGKTLTPRDIDYRSIVSWLRRAYPASQFEFETRIIDWDAPLPFDLGTKSCGEANATLSTLRKLDVAGGKNALFHYYGVVYDGGDPNNRSFMRGCASLPAAPDPSAIGSGPAGAAGAGLFVWDKSTSFAGWYAGHELGHTYGRPHLNGGCGEVGDDPNWPNDIPKKAIGTPARPFVAFDAGDETLQAPMSVTAWDKAADLMTYCPNVWPSAHNYVEICNRLSAENNRQCPAVDMHAGPGPVAAAEQTALSGPGGNVVMPFTAARVQLNTPRVATDANTLTVLAQASTPVDPPATGPVLSITGRINLDEDSGKIMSINRLEKSVDTPQSAAPSQETPVIKTFDSQGKLLSESPAGVLLDTDRLPNSPRTGVVSGEVPYASDIARLELVYKDKTIASRSAGAARPAVSQPAPELPTLRDMLRTGPLGGMHQFQLNIGPNTAPSQPQVDATREAGLLVYKWRNETNGPVKYTVQISTNGGKDWKTVAVETTQHSITIDPSWIADASTLDVRVRASDGIHETFATSRQLDLGAKLPSPQ